MSLEEQRTEHVGRSRYLKLVEAVNFTPQEMLTGIFSSVSPSLITSVNQLHGDRKGVVRLTCKSLEAAMEFENKVAARRVQINGVRLANVTASGQFIKVNLMDVPEYLSSSDIEKELKEYGNVVHVKREYIDYHGYKIENESRHVLFSTLHKDLPSKFSIDGHDVFVCNRPHAKHRQTPTQNADDKDPLISQPNNIPRYVMSAISNARPQAGEHREKSSKYHSEKTPPGVKNSPDHVNENCREHLVGSRKSSPANDRRHYNWEVKSEDRERSHASRPRTIFPEGGGYRGSLSRRRSLDHEGLAAEREQREYYDRQYARSKTPDNESRI